MKLFKFIFIGISCLVSQTIWASNDDYAKPTLLYEDYIYTSNIKTVRFYFNGWETGFPAIRLNSDEKLNFGFDDFDNDYKTYNYTVVHCDAAWSPTNISPSDYIEGYTEDQISDIKRSFNTIQQYTHYHLILPTEVLKITKSGNYLLKVFLNGDQDQLALTRRFMVYEEEVDINFDIHPATLNEFRFLKQEVDFRISSNYYKILDPLNDLKVVIMQNDRFDTKVEGLKPVFIRDKELDYNYDEENTFNGGKEFRYFNVQGLRSPDIRINKIRVDSNNFSHIHLYNDDKRGFKRYAFEKDINGKFIIKTTLGDSPDTDADYVYVYFYLMSDAPLTDGEVYIFGALSDWQCKEEYKMKYDKDFKGYRAQLFLKQGFYNYEYVVKGQKMKLPDDTLTEGNRFETENDYTIMVYHQPIGVFYDKLIAYKKTKSNATKP
jgi:hypothetical protein